jgi:parallel beta-helix repeat protein
MHDVTIRDLVIEASNRTMPGYDPNSSRSVKGGYNRGGLLFRSEGERRMQRIILIDLTVRNGTYSGVSISGAGNVNVDHCDFSENGAGVPPGPKLNHNLLLAHCNNVQIRGSRLVTSPSGSGVSLDHCSDVSIANCEIARNGYYGILLAECKHVSVTGNLLEANDRSGVMAEFLFNGNEYIVVSNNLIQYNNGYGVESHASVNSTVKNNIYEGNGNEPDQEKISADKRLMMDK